MAENKHEHGKMDVTEHQKTFDGFIKMSSYVAVGAILLLIFIYAVNG
jgi:hypothetical protein